jgi:hypothetical protein
LETTGTYGAVSVFALIECTSFPPSSGLRIFGIAPSSWGGI